MTESEPRSSVNDFIFITFAMNFFSNITILIMHTNQEVHNAFEVIKNGGIILYPTDTVWGIGCDASNDEAVKKIFELKKRADSKSMIVLANEKILYQTFPKIPETAFQIWEFSEKPTTLILDKPKNVSPLIVAEDNSLGVRLVSEPFCFKLLERLRKPLVSTSANISGMPTPNSFKEISTEIINGVDYVVNLNREKICNKPSTIIKLGLDNVVKIIRK